MIVAGSASPLLLASAGGYNLTRSLRFRSSASAFLNRTLTTPTNNLRWTWSGWVKRGTLGASNPIFYGGDGSSNNFGGILFRSDDTLQFAQINGGSYNVQVYTNAVFRDPSAWYHIVVVYDSPNATSTDRVQLYVNGTRQTLLTYLSGPFAQNTASKINSALGHFISKLDFASVNFDGYQTEINFIDGQALTPSSFGATNASTGVWQPRRYAGTYGTNGFYLPFTNNSTTTTLGNDFSGNGNNWTTNNISLTAGSTYDSMTDVPTLTSATASNFCVLNPLAVSASTGTCSNGNLTSTGINAGGGNSFGTIALPTSGKFYWEVTPTNLGGNSMIGVSTVSAASSYFWQNTDGSLGYYNLDGNRYLNSGATTYGATYTVNDVIGVAVDLDGGTVTFYKNNTSQGAITFNASNLFPAVSDASGIGASTFQANFGQRPFTYTPPTGFVALNTFNLPTPTIGATASTQANKYMDINLWTGNGSTQTITNSGSMQPDWVWIKRRESAGNNALYDSVRGVGNVLVANSTGAEVGSVFGVSSFNSNGFALGSHPDMNASGGSYVGWQWRASNATAVTNTAGSITSTVSANTSAGFSVVTYAGTSAAATVGHGLGVAPAMIIVKSRTLGSGNWCVYHKNLSALGAVFLNLTNGYSVNSNIWNNTAPTSTVFSLANSDANNGNCVAYCFSEIAGYSAFGSYTGNGSADGTFVFTGFRPRYVMVKRTDSAIAWIVYDTARNTSNVTNLVLQPNVSTAEVTAVDIDVLSNGFKLRTTDAAGNASGGTYIYMAFAESPFKYANAR
jgi:hypothetical protein